MFCRLDTYYKFIFVRDPFTRLLSAWKDKFLREDISGTRRRFGPKIINKYRLFQSCSLLYYRPQRSWGKVMFLHVCVILFTGGCYPSMHCRWYPSMPCSRSQGGSAAGGVSSRGSAPWRGAWWRPPRDSYCCGRYASYWNAFLLVLKMFLKTCTTAISSPGGDNHIFFQLKKKLMKSGKRWFMGGSPWCPQDSSQHSTIPFAVPKFK